jgi:hypothetical protein
MGPSASEPETVAISESSEGSSSKVNSPVSLVEVKEGKIAGGDETMENFDLEAQLEDLMICHDDISDKSIDTWKMGLELFEDDNSILEKDPPSQKKSKTWRDNAAGAELDVAGKMP